MIILNEQNIADYIKKFLFDKLDFVKDGNIEKIIPVSGGLVSAVFKVRIDDRNIYLKQAIPGRLDKLKEIMRKLPDDIFIIFNDNRQYAEVKALKIFEQAMPNGFTPHLFFHDTENNVMALSEVCSGGHLFVDTMNKQINIKITEILGKNIALLSNYTYGKIQKLRDNKTEEEIRRIKYKYEVGTVWQGITDKNKREEAQKRANNFIKNSLNINKVLVHGDYYERNILIRDDQCAVVDFEEGHLGDPVEDIGKLSASYCLRIAYFEKVRQDAFDSILKLLRTFFSNLKIPESKVEMEKRLKVMIAGVMLLSVDGLRNNWLPWVHDENKRKLARELALCLILDNDKEIETVIIDFYKKL
ncbi:aminoglycoside phosphotransferase family protein [Candidatus Parcubacteria bacterium]|nr:aminoglycoside phosphotransferase family protein [Candidatus Parcubacteria bacterium]